MSFGDLLVGLTGYGLATLFLLAAAAGAAVLYQTLGTIGAKLPADKDASGKALAQFGILVAALWLSFTFACLTRWILL